MARPGPDADDDVPVIAPVYTYYSDVDIEEWEL